MAEKKQTANKGSKAKTATKKAAPKPKAIDWDSMPAQVVVIGTGKKSLKKGQEYPANKEVAKVLIEHGKATLKG
jgi:hypothetical protein